MEQTAYQNINKIISNSYRAFRFFEQKVMFDFNPVTHSVCMQVAERHDVRRFR